MTLAFALWLLGIGPSPGIHHCDENVIDWDDAGNLICVDDGQVYPEGNYALGHDADDGDINEVTVWR